MFDVLIIGRGTQVTTDILTLWNGGNTQKFTTKYKAKLFV